MKNRMIKIIILIFICATFSINRIYADSGFDVDYNSSSGINSNGTTDRYSGSSNNNVLGWLGYTKYGDFTKEHPIITIIIYGIVLVFVIFMVITITKHLIVKIKQKEKTTKKEIDIDEKKLEKEIIKIFKEIQLAWMKKDIKKLQKNLTDELYNTYIMQLNILKEKKQKNIIKNIICTDIKITSIENINNNLIIKSKLSAQFRDYIINSTKKVIRGSRFIVYMTEYDLEFIVAQNNIKECPKCGAKIKDNICEYCKSIIPDNNFNLALSKKEIKCQNQKNITNLLIILLMLLVIGVVSIIML